MRLLVHLWLRLGSKVTTRVREAFHYTFDQVPQQLFKLVKQAHLGEPVDMLWNIAVSSEMQDALCQPLTPEQLATMRAAEKGVFSTSVNGYLISSRFENNELSGVVQVSVPVHSKYSKHDMAYPAVKLRSVVRRTGGQHPDICWEVASVEKVA